MNQQPFQIIGHRGARGHAPENTLASVRKALALGVHAIEIDVQLHEGALLVFHDVRLERTTNGRGRLADQPLAALRRLDAGGGERIPLLEEVLDCVDGGLRLNVEMKTAQGTAEAVAALLRRYLQRGWPTERLLVSSFHHPELHRFHQLLPEVPVGALLAGVPLDLAACTEALGARTLALADEFAEPALIEDARRRGLEVLVYTVNEPDEVRHCRSIGVHGVFTDYPDRAFTALGIA